MMISLQRSYAFTSQYKRTYKPTFGRPRKLEHSEVGLYGSSPPQISLALKSFVLYLAIKIKKDGWNKACATKYSSP